jgi:NADH-quinone oxidoreductase subunit I
VDYHHPKNKRAIFPRIDVISCMYCGLCEEACPTDAIRLEKEFPVSMYDRSLFDYDTYEISKDQGQVALERAQGK